MVCPRNQGFTLVELAIVMTIIGLLIGGILKGQELIINAKIKRVLVEFRGIEAAAQDFTNKYGQLPGDMVNATLRIPGCSGGIRICGDGNGNSFVGYRFHGLLDQAGLSARFGSTQDTRETSYFWKHLALADYLAGVDPHSDIAEPQWGVTHPKSAFNGGYHIQRTDGFGAGGGGNPGHWIRLQSSADGVVLKEPGLNPVSAHVAWRIDSKVDDGVPSSGFIQAVSEVGAWGLIGTRIPDMVPGGPGCGVGTNGAPISREYLPSKDLTCILYYKILGT